MSEQLMSVAIVDDDPIVCSSLTTIIEASGVANVVWTAHDGESAVALFVQQPPSILLIDVQMPRMDGLEASKRILEQYPDANILVLTTFADPEYIRRAVQLQTKGYLIKQDVSSVVPAMKAVAAGQVVLGAQVLAQLPLTGAGDQTSEARENSDDRFSHLTEREVQIMHLVAQGLDNRQIAGQLYLSEGTVRNRISDILAKTNISNRTKLAIEWLSSH